MNKRIMLKWTSLRRPRPQCRRVNKHLEKWRKLRRWRLNLHRWGVVYSADSTRPWVRR